MLLSPAGPSPSPTHFSQMFGELFVEDLREGAESVDDQKHFKEMKENGRHGYTIG